MPPLADRPVSGAAIGPLFLGSDIYRGSSYGGLHPLRVPRVSTVIDLGRALGWLPPERYRTSPRAKAPALHLWHRPDYIAALIEAERLAQAGLPAPAAWPQLYGLGTLSNPLFPEMFCRPATGAGGMLWAAEALAAAPAGVLHVPGGGTHHGMAGRANGFCYLNDVVLGLKALQRAGLRRLAYIDIDAHHSDGVEVAFASQPDVLMISVHEEARWPHTGAVQDDAGGNGFNLPVPRGFNDSEMALVRDQLILPRVAAHRPEAIVLQCGADALEEDPLSRLALSNRAHLAVVAALRPLAPRLIVTGGGGYNPWSVGRLWTAIWGLLSGQDLPDVLPRPAQAVLRGLSWNGGSRPPPAEHLLTTLLDAPRDGPVRPEIRDRLARLAAR
ncbi:acetoin utilization protein AcuC [Gemmobacter fulvus]|uniref:Acetoin utilization protein AcuC n=1 Tax=Gemmobacter fulvus TaxID=2840474 RepID=A0A975P749_9RHOB|nr:acetoin utilization protein AcuC [Gemmobacter fulvus]MBT9244170.1 acetoin utilization protein AcuC [Gemmobacter fulvus]QWK91074.1 acetoin utilization protein AcuC [Gemmobacter fulvus]